jgi:hypothetical protein
MHRGAETPASEARENLVDIHVRAGPGARLHDTDGELLGVAPGRDLERRVTDGGRERRRQLAEFAVGFGRRPFDLEDGARLHIFNGNLHLW